MQEVADVLLNMFSPSPIPRSRSSSTFSSSSMTSFIDTSYAPSKRHRSDSDVGQEVTSNQAISSPVKFMDMGPASHRYMHQQMLHQQMLQRQLQQQQQSSAAFRSLGPSHFWGNTSPYLYFDTSRPSPFFGESRCSSVSSSFSSIQSGGSLFSSENSFSSSVVSDS